MENPKQIDLVRRIGLALAGSLFLGLAACQRKVDPSSFSPNAPSATQPATAEAAAPDNENAVLSELTQAVRRYGAEQQRRPKTLQEVAKKGYLPSIPAAPAGKKFVINKNL